jgi:hypothetical protein
MKIDAGSRGEERDLPDEGEWSWISVLTTFGQQWSRSIFIADTLIPL